MIRLIKIVLTQIGKGSLMKYILLGILSGLFSFLLINSVTRVVGLIMSGGYTKISKENIVIFASIILFFVWIRRSLSLLIINLSQNIFWRLRKEVLEQVLNANFMQLTSRKAKIHSAMLGDVYVLTDAALNIIQFFTASILAVACFIYLATISFQLFLITLVVSAVGVLIYHFGSIRNIKKFDRSRRLENKFQQNFNDILDGAKEIYMEPRKGRYIYEERISAIADDAYKNNVSAFTGFLNNQISGQVCFYILILSVLLYFSITLNIKPADSVTFVFTLLYLQGSIETIMVLLPGLMRARVASSHMMNLKDELEEANFSNPVPKRYLLKNDFSNIGVRGLEFHYSDAKDSFSVGPVDFDVSRGEVIFIYGGNGSGKTTFIYSVLGLCFPSAGEIFLNDVPVTADNYPEYRTLFSVVFSNFHLFDGLFGIEHFDLAKWEFYLRLFELEGKVQLDGRSFTTTSLSTGQRKRLALISALMEQKPIVVLDEWAADQDPYFRRKFYTEIIPMLKKDDITVIAITHDDRYYHCADKLYKMDYGKLIQEKIRVYEPSASI